MQTKVVELDLNDVLPNRFQPRIKFSEESIQALSDSIKEHGVIQPIVVRNIGDKYEIIAGERRYKASVLAGKQTIPAIITDLNEKDSAEVAIIENVQRKDLTPIEEAISYKKILDMGYLTQDSLASKLGKTQSTIANKLRLLNLDDDVQEALLNEKISERHARSLLKLSSHEKQRQLLQRIISERLTVRKTDEEIDKMMNNSDNVETLSFDSLMQTPEGLSFDNERIEETFTPNLETLNIPTEPIFEDSIPEVLPVVEPKPTTSFFEPKPEIINSTVPPISFEMFKEFEEPVSELNSNSMVLDNNKIEEISTIPNIVEPINDGLNEVESPKLDNMTDIFSEKPLAPMDNLLEPSTSHTGNVSLEKQNPGTEIEEDTTEDILVPGKFFNLMPEDEDLKQEPATSMEDFNFDFDINSLNNMESTDGFSSLDNLGEFKFDTLDESVATNNQPANQNFFNFDLPEGNATNLDIDAEVTQNGGANSFDELSNLSVPNVDAFTNFEPETIAEGKSTDIEPLMPSNASEVVDNTTKDVKVAINMIRELSDNLEKMGYTVDLDEFDFENMYQFIFKIDK